MTYIPVPVKPGTEVRVAAQDAPLGGYPGYILESRARSFEREYLVVIFEGTVWKIRTIPEHRLILPMPYLEADNGESSSDQSAEQDDEELYGFHVGDRVRHAKASAAGDTIYTRLTGGTVVGLHPESRLHRPIAVAWDNEVTAKPSNWPAISLVKLTSVEVPVEEIIGMSDPVAYSHAIQHAWSQALQEHPISTIQNYRGDRVNDLRYSAMVVGFQAGREYQRHYPSNPS